MRIGTGRLPACQTVQRFSSPQQHNIAQSKCLQVLSMVRGLTAPDLYAATEHNLHEFAVNVSPAGPTL